MLLVEEKIRLLIKEVGRGVSISRVESDGCVPEGVEVLLMFYLQHRYALDRDSEVVAFASGEVEVLARKSEACEVGSP